MISTDHLHFHLMVVGYHLLWTAYGWWLPNDPRGSMSRQVASVAIAELGELHYGRRNIQPASHDLTSFYARARETLNHELLVFGQRDIEAIGEAFAEAIQANRYTCYACAIMRDHVHLLIRVHRHKAEQMIAIFQSASAAALIQTGRRPESHPVWGGPGWKVFLNSRQDMRRTVNYVDGNPRKAGRPAQKWPFVVAYDGWMPGLRAGVAKPQASRRDLRKDGAD